MLEPEFTFSAAVWLYEGPAAWHFLTLPADVAEEIEDLPVAQPKAFGSHPVRVTIGSTEWETSVFKDTKRESYVLPLKAAVRRAEKIEDGDTVECRLALR